VCAYPTDRYCHVRGCGVGDAGCNAKWDNFKRGGCDDGLACGVDNCAVFHAIGPRTGLTESSDCCEARCESDDQCPRGAYCTQEQVCVKPTEDYCVTHTCGFGDAGCSKEDDKGCASGLVCGFNNCAKYHELGVSTGLTGSSDCCEGCFSDRDCPKGTFCTDKHICEIRETVIGCHSDKDCQTGFYCTSRKQCTAYHSEYCYKNWCGIGDGDCDPSNDGDCAPGLVCGINNCHKFHETNFHTGIPTTGDCCELPVSKLGRGRADMSELNSLNKTGYELIDLAKKQADIESMQVVVKSDATFSLLSISVIGMAMTLLESF